MPEHIKVPAITPVVRYAGDGTTTNYSYSFPIFASEDLRVFIDGAEQISGFTINGAGETSGGAVIFDNAPQSGSVITLLRDVPIERMSDFIEGGDFSAKALNTELDFLVAAVQQVERDNDLVLKYSAHETPSNTTLPDKALRANKALGFDEQGDLIALSVDGLALPQDFTAVGTGAVERSMNGKAGDMISAKDFGALGDGLNDDRNAIQNALSAYDHVYLPQGTYLVSGTLSVGTGKTLYGHGQTSIIQAQNNTYDVLEVSGSNAQIKDLAIKNGRSGIICIGKSEPCRQNRFQNIVIEGASTGLTLDGYQNTTYKCQANNFFNIVIKEADQNGVHLDKTGAGTAPSENNFINLQVNNASSQMVGAGVYVQHGTHNNFTNCVIDIDGTQADACVRIGADAGQTALQNVLTRSAQSLPNIQLDLGSSDTSIIDLDAQASGLAIYDLSGGSYQAINSGGDEKNRLIKSVVTDLKATLFRNDTEFIETPGTHDLDLSHTIHLVSAFGGEITLNLPKASDAIAAFITIKKFDQTANVIRIQEKNGPGPDNKTLILGGPYDYMTAISNGQRWHIIASNRMAGNTRFIDQSGTVDIDMAVDTYLLSAYSGAMTARLPPANAVEAIGRTITLKKMDVSGNSVTVTEQGGSGPDQSSHTLSSTYHAITVVSDGAQWFVVSKYP